MSCIAVIPARGGSKGIPRKNLRPMAGKPLIYYSIKACLDSELVDTVVVSTDDEEIALFARRFGAEVLMRGETLADDIATLDPVIEDAVARYELSESKQFSTVLTVQPTSPLITSEDITAAVKQYTEQDAETLMSVVDDRHLCWEYTAEGPVPAYKKRVNRQQLPAKYKETGAIVICDRKTLEGGTRIGKNVTLYIMDHDKSHDIDTLSDFYLCESLLSRKKITFVVAGNQQIGLGHAYRTVMLANELVRNQIEFIVTDEHLLAKDYISRFNYPVKVVVADLLLEELKSNTPDLVINDILDTDENYILELKKLGIKVVNFEDLGSGIEQADLVFNALYPTQLPYSHVYSGADYFCLREEFLHLPEANNKTAVENVILCFGGVDEGNITLRSVKAIADICAENKISITAVLGLGYQYEAQLREYTDRLPAGSIEIVKGTPRISDYMVAADLALTSGGRTVFELAAMNVPTIVVCQNKRELTHKFATSENGVINLGYREDVDDEQIRSTFASVAMSQDMRNLMLEKAKSQDLTGGKKRVISMIEALLKGE